jgi:hypothetical protein
LKTEKEHTMTALAFVTTPDFIATASDATSVETGTGVEMFSSGSMPTSSDMMSGDGLEMFTTSAISTTTSAQSGDKVELFTTSA